MQFSETVQRLTAEAEEKLAPLYKEIDAVSFRNTEKIMDAFRRHRVSEHPRATETTTAGARCWTKSGRT